MLAWTGLPSVITTVSWIPWCLGLTVLLFEGPRLRAGALLALAVAMMLLGGHLQFAAYGGIAIVLFMLVLIVKGGDLRSTGLGLAALLLGGMLASPQLLPVLSYSEFSHRANKPTEEGYGAYAGSAIGKLELPGLVFPTAVGNPTKPVPGTDGSVNAYWPAFTKAVGDPPRPAGANFAESAIGIGPFLIVLIFLRKRLTAGQLGVALVGAVGALLALGTPLGRLLYFYAPGWSATGSPGRAAVLLVLALAVFAGAGVGALLEDRELARKRLPMAGIAMGLALLHALGPMLFSPAYPNPYGLPVAPADLASGVVADELPIILVSVVLTLVGLYSATRYRSAQWVLPAMAALIALTSYGIALVRTGEPLPRIDGPTDERIAVVNSGWQLLQTSPALLPPNTNALSRIHTIGGYDSLLHRDTVAVLREINGRDPAPAANGNMMFVFPSADPGKLAAAGVTQVWSRSPLPQFATRPEMRQGYAVYRLDGPGRVSSTSDAAQIVSEGFGRLTVRATGPGVLTVRERNMRGWRATLAGQSLPIREGLWITLDIPRGEHQVRLDYSPPGMSTGLLLCGLALAVVAVMLAFGLRGKKVREASDVRA